MEDKPLVILQSCIGRSVKTVFRILYAENGKHIQWEKGCLEIEFDSQKVLFLTIEPNGSTLMVKLEKWKDPLAGFLDDETIQWVEETGRDIKVDVSTIYPFSQLVNQRLKTILPIHLRDTLCGVQFDFDGVFLNFYTAWDECEIEWGESPNELIGKQLKIIRPH